MDKETKGVSLFLVMFFGVVAGLVYLIEQYIHYGLYGYWGGN